MLICSICASTDGPFIQEPTGVPTSPFFIKCQACTQKYPYISFDKTVGKGAPLKSVSKYFYQCEGCGNLFYNAIPYAFQHYGVKACPGCQHPFPSEKDIQFPPSSLAYKSVLKGANFSLSSTEIEELYEKLLLIQPQFSKAIEKIFLVELPKGSDIWVICIGNDSEVENALRSILLKETDRRMTFSSSQRFEFAMETEGLKVLRESTS